MAISPYSMSFKVTDFGTNRRKAGEGFVLPNVESWIRQCTEVQYGRGYGHEQTNERSLFANEQSEQ